MNVQELPRKLWAHANPKSTAMYKLMEEINEKQGIRLKVSS
jgi:acetoacetyl-CoA synthetase